MEEEGMDIVNADARGTKRKADESIATVQAPKRIKVEFAHQLCIAGPVDLPRLSIKMW